MEFGRLQEDELDRIDFGLPADPSFNKKILKSKRTRPKVYVGCSKWGRVEWLGKIYPPKTREKNFLDHYVRHYNSIELNTTHYKIFGPMATQKWAAKADIVMPDGSIKDFLFCPKMFKGVTHRGKLIGKDFVLNEFLRGIIAFGRHLGPVFIQVSESFSPKRKDELFCFLKGLPTNMQFFLEVRHHGWFLNASVKEELFSTLKEINVGAVITDAAGRRDCVHMYLTLPKTFIRFVGNSLHATDFARIDEWAQRIKSWIHKGVTEVYFFMHMHDEAKSPELSLYLVEQLNKHCGLELAKPEFMNDSTSGGAAKKRNVP